MDNPNLINQILETEKRAAEIITSAEESAKDLVAKAHEKQKSELVAMNQLLQRQRESTLRDTKENLQKIATEIIRSGEKEAEEIDKIARQKITSIAKKVAQNLLTAKN